MKRRNVRTRQNSGSSPIFSPPRRTIPSTTRLILFVQAGGRCEFDGCNHYLLEHPVTLTEGNFAQVAHIVAFRPDGARGRAGSRQGHIHDLNNLMLLCPACHILVDRGPSRYTRQTLQEYKRRHEEQIRHATGLTPELRTWPLVVTANIGSQSVSVPFEHIYEAVSPRYPASKIGTTIDLTQINIDGPSAIETTARTISGKVKQLYDSGSDAQRIAHISVFALGPIPLLVYLGTQLSNKIPVDLYQRHRDKENWTWKKNGRAVQYRFVRIRRGTDPNKVALVASLSGRVPLQAVSSTVGSGYSIYELSLDRPTPTFLKTRRDLEEFRIAYQSALAEIVRTHGTLKTISFFPAVPAPVAVLCGRELLPKVHPAIRIYDFDKSKGGFEYQLTVNDHEHR